MKECSSYKNFAPKKVEAIFNISISAVNPWDSELNSDTTLDQCPFLDPCLARIFFTIRSGYGSSLDIDMDLQHILKGISCVIIIIKVFPDPTHIA